jgi:hypothetical protein
LGLVAKLSPEHTQHGSAFFSHHRRRALLGSACALGFAIAIALGTSPAAAKAKVKPGFGHGDKQHASKEPFGDIPKGPLQIFISINQQKLHLYSDGALVADTLVATGVPGHLTPLGVFDVIGKDRFHRSNIYSNAPMPFMQRITWSGVAMHEGVGVGHQASHGCIRMPHDFAARLWVLTKLGVRVIIARNELRPAVFADSHLFVHKDVPSTPTAGATDSIKTAQSIDSSKTTDAGAAAPPVQPGETTSGVTLAADPAEPATQSAPVSASAAASAAVALDPPLAEPPQSEAPATAGANPPGSLPTLQQAEPAAAAAAIGTYELRGGETGATVPVAAPDDVMPLPLVKPAALLEATAAAHAPIAIFVSRKTKRIYVRQHFTPLFDAPITIDQPERPLGTHVFTAMEYLNDGSTFRWNVVSLSGELPRAVRIADNDKRFEKHAKAKRRDEALDRPAADPPAQQSPEAALARIEIPQDVIDQISELMVPGSSLIVSDQGLGEETGEGTDFVVITP